MRPHPEDEIDRTAFVNAMGQLPSGVVLVTVCVGGRPWGLTISSCSSLSAEPPQILISIGSRTVTCKEIVAGGRFGISVLGAEHREVATLGSATGVAKFVDEYCQACDSDGGEMPRVHDALYHLDCQLVAAHEHADHTVIVGGVDRAVAGPGATVSDPLIYFDRAYRRIGDSLA
jgi:flavin reductase (DIM6/NTAB) family NADH-FMN oxidoreductase RutF